MAKNIPLVKPFIGEDEILAVERVMKSELLTQGLEVEAFENEFSYRVNKRYCVAVNSGTSALHLGLLAAGIGPGDEVILPSFTFAASANAVALTGATTIFADIDPDTFCISSDSVNGLIGPKTSAIIAVHLYGHPADMGELTKIAEKNNLLLFEDAAQAHLAEFEGQRVGTFGSFAAFSFYATKNMTTGEGGMVVTPDASIARKVRLLRNQGMIEPYKNEVLGFNNRMTDIAASIGRVQLEKLEDFTVTREKNAAEFDKRLLGVVTPKKSENIRHVYHQYTIRIENREEMAMSLKRKGIETGVYYRTPVHQLNSFAGDFFLPETERAAKEVLSIPVFPSLDDEQINQIIEGING